jgi:superfamily II DNA or RNA helicase
MQSEKTIEFLKKLKYSGNYNENYDYSKFNFEKLDTKSIIIDEFGFEHEVIPSTLLKGSDLNFHNVIDKSGYFIFKSKEIHGDSYDYSKTKYVNSDTSVKIYCKKHKIEFNQLPYNHLMGKGCSICGREKTNEKRLKTSKLDNLKNKYPEIDFSKSIYKSTLEKILVTDKNGLDYLISPSKLEAGQSLCLKNCTDKTKYFIKESNKIHENKYDYSKSKYTNSNKLIEIICQKHGSFFQKPSDHTSGKGCLKCSGSVKKTTEQFIKESVDIHGDRYDYSKVNYTGAWDKVEIICREHQMSFFQYPVNHVTKSQGCPACGGNTTKYKLKLLNELETTDLLTMDPFELFIIIGQGKLPDDFKSISQTDANSEERLMSINELKKKLEKEVFLEEHGLSEVSDENDNNETSPSSSSTVTTEELSEIDDVDDELNKKKPERKLPEMSGMNEFHSLDSKYYATMDSEAFSALILNKTQKLWNKVLNNLITIEDIEKEIGGKYFTTIKETFLNEYRVVNNFSVPENYQSHTPNLMQKLTVTRLVNQNFLLNLSGTGAGKTISMILASRTVNSKLSVIIALNSTVEQISKEILKAFPDSLIFDEHKIGKIYDRTKHNYLVLNYEKFQLSYSEGLYQDLTNNNIIDFVSFDELQNVKQRDDQESIRRGVLKRLMGRIRENNTNLYTLGMSATPVINNLNEAKSLLEIVSGQNYDDLDTHKSISNALRIYQHFLINGLRYLPNYDIELHKEYIEIDGYDLIDEILKLPKNSYVELEKLLLNKKLESIKDYLGKGICIYTHYITDFKNKIYDFVTNLGFTCVCYTGDEGDDRKENLDKFLKGKVDILIGSKPITTGVDGLQNVCNTLIVITQPWTSSDETQLHGRFYRQGSAFDKVTVLIPQVKIDIDDKTWSWDKQRTNLIENKKTLADLAVDGKIPSRILPSKETLYKKSIESLEIWKNRVNEGNIIEGNRKSIDIDLYPELDSNSKRDRINSELSEFNRRGKTTLSSTMNKEFNNNPDSWFKYHSLRRESMKDWSEIPYEYISTKIKNKNHKVVDFGCGENLFKNFIPNEVISFDHIAIDETVIACDMSDVSNYLDDESVDVTVFSLALWGTNYKDYIKEAYRVLNWGGYIYIAEPSKNYETDEDVNSLINLLTETGFEIVGGVDKRNKFIYIKGSK